MLKIPGKKFISRNAFERNEEMKLRNMIILLILNLTVSGFAQNTQSKKMTIVAFEASTAENQALAEKVEDEFEAALLNHSCFQILERDRINFLRNKRSNEIQLMLSEATRNPELAQLKTKNVEYIVLGKITESNEEGNIKISVRVVNFESDVIAYKNIYVPMSFKLDAAKRNKALTELAVSLCPKRNQLPIEKEFLDTTLLLEKVEMAGPNLKLSFTLINNSPSTQYSLKGHSIAFDERGRERYINLVKLVDKSHDFKGKGVGGWSGPAKRLIYNRPAPMVVFFNEFPHDANQISELTLHFFVENRGSASVVFENIDIPRSTALK